ncbi:MAG: hypothetical protein CSYNP_03753 [Syntrophus sp. SKADARSKE-3]|nr:hypothetical protein [Syntrophus sp. SKADARSKE-3]
MANSNTISVQIEMKDKGSVVVKQFSDNAEKAMGKTAAATGEANSAFSGMMGSLKNLAALMGVAFGVTEVVGFAKEAITLAARVETLGVVLGVVGQNAGYSRGEMSQYVDEVKKMGITTEAALSSVIKIAQAQIDVADSAKLARVAQDAAVIGNINSSEAFSRMIDGIRSGEVEILKTIGLQVNFETAYQKAAIALGKSSDALTEREKAQARANIVLEAGTRIEGAYEASLGTAGKAMLSLSRFTEELKLGLGQLFGPGLTAAVFGVTDILKAWNKELETAKGNGQWDEMTNIVSGAFKVAWIDISNLTKAALGFIQLMSPIIKDIGAGVGVISYGWGGVFAALKPIGEFLGNSVALTWELTKILGQSVTMTVALASGQADVAKTAWEEAKKSASKIEELSQKNAAILKSGVTDAVAEYDMQAKAAMTPAQKQTAAEKAAQEAISKARADAAAANNKLREEEEQRLKYARDRLISAEEAKFKTLQSMNKTYLSEMEKDSKHESDMAKVRYESDFTIRKRLLDDMEDINIEYYNRRIDEIKAEANLKQLKEREKFNSEAFYKEKYEELDAQDLARANDLARQKKLLADQLAEKNKESQSLLLAWERKQDADKLISDKYLMDQRVDINSDALDKILYYEVLTGQKIRETNAEIIQSMIDDYQDTFVGGWKAGLLEIQKDQITWGDAMSETAKGTYSGMVTAFSTSFEDVYKGKLQGLGDYANMIWDSTRKAFFKLVADMASQKIMAMFTAEWSTASKLALSIIDKLLNLTGITGWLDSLNVTYYDPNEIWMAGGGMVPGVASYPGDHSGNDTVLARLSPDEYVEPRSAVNAQTLPFLEYIREYGKVPGYADGGKVSDLDKYTAAVNKIDPMSILYIINGAEPGETPYYKVSTPTANPLYRNLGNLYNIGGPGSLEYMMSNHLGWWSTANKYNMSPGNGDPLAGPLEPLNNPIALAKGVQLALKNGMQIYQTPMSSHGFSGFTGFMIDAMSGAYNFMSGVGESLQSIFTPVFWKTIFSAVPAVIAAAATYVTEGALGPVFASMAEELAGGATMAEIGAAEAGTGAAIAGGTTDALIYGSAAYEAALAEVGISSIEDFIAYLGSWTAEDVMSLAAGKLGEAGLKKIGNWGINKLIAGSHDAGGSAYGDYSLSASWSGMDNLKQLGDLNGIVGKQYDYSARDGLDYVPRDGYLVQTHKAEAVLSAKDAADWRSDGGNEIVAELQALRSDIKQRDFFYKLQIDKLANYIEKFDVLGLKTVTA